MTCFYFLVEEESIRPVIEKVALEIFPKEVTFKVLTHQGKGDLRCALKKTVPTLCKIYDSRIIVLQDQDNANCKKLKKEVLAYLKNCECPHKVRIVCTELECWFLGDLGAIAKAYKKFKPDLYRSKKLFRSVDAIQKPAETMHKIIPELKKHKFFPKIRVAQEVAEHLSLGKNTSVSFQQFIQGIKALI